MTFLTVMTFSICLLCTMSSEVGGISSTLCESHAGLIKITKEEYDQVNQALIRICEGEIRVNKCEGKCQSSLQPSFNSPTGFLKKCICCKEQELKKSEFVLNDCFDVNGNKLFGTLANMLITVQEPSSCQCIVC